MDKFMKLAVEEAMKAVKNNEGGPFGAVIVRNGKVISKAHNQVLKTNDPTAHAEIQAIRKASAKLKRFDLSDCELYSSCEPCPMCLSAIIWAKIKTIAYGCARQDAAGIGFDDDSIYKHIMHKPNNIHLHKKVIDKKECLKPFASWRSKKNKKMY